MNEWIISYPDFVAVKSLSLTVSADGHFVVILNDVVKYSGTDAWEALATFKKCSPHMTYTVPKQVTA